MRLLSPTGVHESAGEQEKRHQQREVVGAVDEPLGQNLRVECRQYPGGAQIRHQANATDEKQAYAIGTLSAMRRSAKR